MSHVHEPRPVLDARGLVIPPAEAYGLATYAFALSTPQRLAVIDIAIDWEESTYYSTKTVATPTQSTRLIKFVELKRESFEAALREKRALYFDVLMVGLDIPTAEDERRLAEYCLSNARNLNKTDTASPGYQHINSVRSAMHDLFRLIPAAKDAVAGWRAQLNERIGNAVYKHFDVLKQYGVKELL
ncbi:hypothetical protein JCM10908_005962 [Rhodotorula pacifica]|uniref:uncharacterized protein n=1 Tax=Rhodotorula pacifica TaxID=1495444 RepID=UPI00317735D4